jgi:hypothetical protein
MHLISPWLRHAAPPNSAAAAKDRGHYFRLFFHGSQIVSANAFSTPQLYAGSDSCANRTLGFCVFSTCEPKRSMDAPCPSLSKSDSKELPAYD